MLQTILSEVGRVYYSGHNVSCIVICEILVIKEEVESWERVGIYCWKKFAINLGVLGSGISMLELGGILYVSVWFQSTRVVSWQGLGIWEMLFWW